MSSPHLSTELGIYRDWSADRWAGERVPALCDWPTCNAEIDRGQGHRCVEHDDSLDGCDLFFCATHKTFTTVHDLIRPKPDLGSWELVALTDDAWSTWRREHTEEVAQLRQRHQHADLQATMADLAQAADRNGARAAQLGRVRESASLFRLGDELRTAAAALGATLTREAAFEVLDAGRVLVASSRIRLAAAALKPPPTTQGMSDT